MLRAHRDVDFGISALISLPVKGPVPVRQTGMLHIRGILNVRGDSADTIWWSTLTFLRGMTYMLIHTHVFSSTVMCGRNCLDRGWLKDYPYTLHLPNSCQSLYIDTRQAGRTTQDYTGHTHCWKVS